jgi:LAO/AO transport system kinase
VTNSVADLAAAIREGSVRALARGLTWVEAGGERAEALADTLYPYTGSSHVVGITGAPGAGKSTLVRALAVEARARGLMVAVLAVDPSSPFSGGAILGDRIRMNDITGDGGVFIRSMATRGSLGGLSRAAADAIDVLRASGRPLVLVETVGVGQDEVDIMRVAHTTVVVSVPGLGDEIQALKAGIIEIADIHTVNKADRDGANRTMAELRAILSMDSRARGEWHPPVVACVATKSDGVAALLDEVTRHREHLVASGELAQRERRMAETRVITLAQALVAASLRPAIAEGADPIAYEIDKVARRDLAPHRCARAVLARASEAERGMPVCSTRQY